MLRLELKAVAEYVRKATTEDLLDRVTVYRAEMEPAALDLMENELDRRGVTRDQIADHDTDRRRTAILHPDGTAVRCSRCDRPAVVRGWGWRKLFGCVPVFPRYLALCAVHAERRPAVDPNPPADT